MNVPDINRSILRMHIAAVEAKYPIKIIGLLPRGSAAHVFEDNALDFLAEEADWPQSPWSGASGSRLGRSSRPSRGHRFKKRLKGA